MKSEVGFGYLTAFAVLVILIGAPLLVLGATTTNTVTVSVNISSVGAITVAPNSLSWNTGNLGSLNPGTASAVSNLIIKNTGSLNITSIYLNTSTVADEATNPLQTANATYYSAAGLIFVKNSTDTSYYHAGRLEWNISSVLTNESLNLAGATAVSSHGWYRNSTGNEYLWKVENGTNGFCNATGTTFSIKLNPENQTNLNRDLSTGLSTCGSVGAGTSWGSFACTNGPLSGHCVATSAACNKILIYRYYSTLGDYPSCTNSQPLSGSALIPGTETPIYVFAAVPKGVPAGDAKTGTLTIIGTY